MQHKFPMAFLHFTIDTKNVDVNVHPSKMEVRFSDNQQIFDFLSRRVQEALHGREMIPAVTLSEEKTKPAEAAPAPENTQEKTLAQETKTAQMEAQKLAQQLLSMPRPAAGSGQEQRRMSDTAQRTAAPEVGSPSGQSVQQFRQQKSLPPQPFEKKRLEAMVKEERLEYETKAPEIANAKQMDLFEERILSRKAVQQYQIIGQIFDTYWIASYQDKMILIDQHAAHEKVKYEALMKKLREGSVDSQNLMPPVIVTLSNPEAELLKQYQEYFLQTGFEIEPFGGNSYAIRSVPCDLYGNLSGELLQEILNELASEQKPGTPQAVSERIATMACKSAVKGNHRMDRAEMEELLEQLLLLDNPYHCPHGRPTMITMTKQELEKKFKRIV